MKLLITILFAVNCYLTNGQNFIQEKWKTDSSGTRLENSPSSIDTINYQTIELRISHEDSTLSIIQGVMEDSIRFIGYFKILTVTYSQTNNYYEIQNTANGEITSATLYYDDFGIFCLLDPKTLEEVCYRGKNFNYDFLGRTAK